ncbi:MAG: hypothetical protein QOF86_82, partial [Baekduia sp.]|nr:hypothetical protein [Baekduia sp.]
PRGPGWRSFAWTCKPTTFGDYKLNATVDLILREMPRPGLGTATVSQLLRGQVR